MVKTTGVRSGKIGAAWNNPDGSVSLVLDPGTVIEFHKDVVLTLFPNNRREEAAEPPIPGLSQVWNQHKIV